MFATLDDLDGDATLLVRVDLNSPVEDGEVQDNRRFARHAETLRELSAAGHRVAVLAHQGRPGRDDFVSLAAHADILADHLEADVTFCPDTAGDEALAAIDSLESGELVLLENVRQVEDELADRTPEEHATSTFVRRLAGAADAYVGDAYSTAHRAHASIVGLPTAMESVYAGRVMESEFVANSAIQSRTFDGDVVMVLGGTKAGDLVRVIAGVGDRVDRFLLGGVIGELCLRAQGYEVGFDVAGEELYDGLWAEHEETLRELVGTHADRLVLPSDLAYEDAAGNRAEVAVDGLEKSRPYYDVGARTADRFAAEIEGASAVFVKGALGVFEDERFCDGTLAVLRAIGDGDAFSVVGGGDTSRAIDLYALEPADYDHVSIAGGAYVRALAGERLPGVEALRAESPSAVSR